MAETPATEDRATLLTTEKFRVVEVARRLADGSTKTRAVVRHPGAVTILPLLDGDRICLIRNFRVAVGRTLIELPAGTREPGEDPAVTAERELLEETGFRAGQLEPLPPFLLSPGILDEQMHLFVATDLTAGDPRREPGEEIENLIVAWHEALAMIDRGEICDAKTLVGLLLFQSLRRR